MSEWFGSLSLMVVNGSAYIDWRECSKHTHVNSTWPSSTYFHFGSKRYGLKMSGHVVMREYLYDVPFFLLCERTNSVCRWSEEDLAFSGGESWKARA
jgi:hypothetical protein